MQPHPGNFYIQMSIDNNSVMHELPIGIFGFAPQIDTERVWEVTKRDALCTHWLSGLPDKSKNRRLPPAVHA